MKRTGEIVTDLLKEWNIDHIYGMPGDSINELIDDLRKEEKILNSFKFVMKKLEH